MNDVTVGLKYDNIRIIWKKTGKISKLRCWKISKINCDGWTGMKMTFIVLSFGE